MQSLSLDPRSPSGIPRTPILVEDEKEKNDTPREGGDAAATPTRGGASSTKKPPKRGLMAKATRLLPQSKLSFEPIVQDDADEEDKEAEVEVEEKVDPSPIIIETCQDDNVDQKEEESATKENPEKVKSVEEKAGANLEEEEEAKVRSPLANVSNDQSLVI